MVGMPAYAEPRPKFFLCCNHLGNQIGTTIKHWQNHSIQEKISSGLKQAYPNAKLLLHSSRFIQFIIEKPRFKLFHCKSPDCSDICESFVWYGGCGCRLALGSENRKELEIFPHHFSWPRNIEFSARNSVVAEFLLFLGHLANPGSVSIYGQLKFWNFTEKGLKIFHQKTHFFLKKSGLKFIFSNKMSIFSWKRHFSLNFHIKIF